MEGGLEAEMDFSVIYGLPDRWTANKSKVSRINQGKSSGEQLPDTHMRVVELSSQRILSVETFSVLKYVRLAPMSHDSHNLLKKVMELCPKKE